MTNARTGTGHDQSSDENRYAPASKVTGATVYVVQVPSVPKSTNRIIDYSPLEWHGKVEFLLEKSQNASFFAPETFKQIKERLSKFDPDRDFIAYVGGDTLGAFITASVLLELGHDHFFYLRFERTKLPDGRRDPSRGEYIPVPVPLTMDVAERMLTTRR